MNFINFFENDFIVTFPEFFICIAIIFLLSYGVIYSTSNLYNYPILSSNISSLILLVLFIAFLLCLSNSLPSIIVFNNLLIIDFFIIFVKIIILLIAILCILMSFNYIECNKINSFEFTILILLSILGMLLLVSSYDLLALYLAIELMSLSFYILASYQINSEFSGESGLKYFILGAFSSGLLLFGSSLLYGFTGMTNFEDISKLILGIGAISDILSYSGIFIGIFFISIALLFKIGAAPFHMWVPDVYEGSPTPVTILFSTLPKISLLVLYIRLFFCTLYDFIFLWQELFLICAIISIIWGSVAALSQKRIKRLMAYSGIVNVGYMLIGIACGSISSIGGLLIYLIIYIIMIIGFFTFILGIQKSKNNFLIDLLNIGKTNNIIAISLSLILLSLSGIPPLAGFFSKFYLFFAVINSELYATAILGILSSVIAAFYYIRIIKLMYFESSKKYILSKSIDLYNSYVLSSCNSLLLIFFVSSDGFLFSCYKIGMLLSL
jgi:proton-translocating NADH-quinone oxidoreductase chain N